MDLPLWILSLIPNPGQSIQKKKKKKIPQSRKIMPKDLSRIYIQEAAKKLKKPPQKKAVQDLVQRV